MNESVNETAPVVGLDVTKSVVYSPEVAVEAKGEVAKAAEGTKEVGK